MKPNSDLSAVLPPQPPARPGMLNAIKFPFLFASSGLSLSAFLWTGEGEILYDCL